LVVGGLGIIEPRILGVGYANIANILAGHLTATVIITIVGLKLVAWLVYLASGTSGGTLAPLFTFGSGIGALVGTAFAALLPAAQVEPTVAAMVGMAAMFAGATRALLTSVVFAFEATRQPLGLLPLLAGCTTAVLISRLLNRQTIMTDKLAQRGMIVPEDYAVDELSLIPIGRAMSSKVEAFSADTTVAAALEYLAGVPDMRHQAFPVVGPDRVVVGVVTRHDLESALRDATVQSIVSREPIVVTPDETLRDAADQMVRADVGRLPVVDDPASGRLIGIVTRSDLLLAHTARLRAAEQRRRAFQLRGLFKAGRRILSQ
jgi:CBS domain-containing protein